MSEEHAQPDASSPTAPLVFISHDSRDAQLAEAFSKLLSRVSTGMLKSFRSSDKKGVQGIAFGSEWYPELMSKLTSACDVVCLLTPRSVGRPWILYEAGVAKGKLGIPVHGLALGVPLTQASVGPFAQFQNCDDSGDGLTKLIEQLVRQLPNADPDHELVQGQVEGFRTTVREILAGQEDGIAESDAIPGEESSAKLFEEIKVMFQDLPSRIEASARPRSSRKRWTHPRYIEEILMTAGRGEPSYGVATLIVASPFREDVPWLYAMAVEVYRASLGRDRDFAREAYRSFMRALDSLSNGPLARELFESSRDAHILLRELPMMLRHFGPDHEQSNDSHLDERAPQ